MMLFVEQTADASLRQNCSLLTWKQPQGQWLQMDFEQIRQTRPGPGRSHITSPATSVCFISVQCNSTGKKIKRCLLMFALKTHQAHSRCLAASFCCVLMHTPFPGCLHHQKKKEKKRLFMFWIQHTGLANLPLQPNRNKLFDFNRTKSEWRSKLYFLQCC